MVKVFIALAVLSAILALWVSLTLTDHDKELAQWVCLILSGIMFILAFVAFVFNQ